LDLNAAITTGTTTATDNGGGGCFVTTSAYGSHASSYVRILQKTGDRFLINSRIGKYFIKLYDEYSPPLNDFVPNHGSLKIFVRLSLIPFAVISWLTLRLGPLFTITLTALFVFCLVFVFRVKYSK
jgi:hypothetical protein